MATKIRETADRVEFRWRLHEEEFAARLAESARNAGCTPSEHARELLKNALTADDRIEHAIESVHQELSQLHDHMRHLSTVKEGVRTVHEDIYQLRDDLAACAAKLLTDAGRLDVKAAEEWVKNTLDTE